MNIHWCFMHTKAIACSSFSNKDPVLEEHVWFFFKTKWTHALPWWCHGKRNEVRFFDLKQKTNNIFVLCSYTCTTFPWCWKQISAKNASHFVQTLCKFVDGSSFSEEPSFHNSHDFATIMTWSYSTCYGTCIIDYVSKYGDYCTSGCRDFPFSHLLASKKWETADVCICPVMTPHLFGTPKPCHQYKQSKGFLMV